jgi:hypothetical protein
MAKLNTAACFSDLADAKSALAAVTGKRRRLVYRASNGSAEVFVVATSAVKARAYASRHFGISVTPAEQPERKPPTRRSLAEQVTGMTDEQRAELLALLQPAGETVDLAEVAGALQPKGKGKRGK